MFHFRRMVLFRSRPGSRNVQKEKQNDDIFPNEPGIFFLEQTFVGRWSANRAARDDGSVANDVFRISVGGGGLWKKNWKICSQKKTAKREIRHQRTGTGAEIKVVVML